MLHLVVCLEGEGSLIDLERGELLLQRVQELDVDDELLQAGDQARLQPAGRLHHQVRPGQERREHGVEALIGGLRVAGLAGRQGAAARAPRQAVVPGQLARGEQTLGRLGATERRRARLHVDGGQERSEDHWAAGVDQLGEHHAGERLGGLLGDRGRHRHRRHRPHQQERGDHGSLARLGVGQQCFEHPGVVAQRRVHVDHGEHRGDRRAAIGRGRVVQRQTAVQDPGHLDAVEGIDLGQRGPEERLVGHGGVQVRHVQVPGVQRQVVGLDRRGAGKVERVEVLHQLDHLLQVVEGAFAPDVARAEERRSGDRGESHMVTADPGGAGLVAGPQVEHRRHCLDRLEDEVGVEVDHGAVDLLA